MDASIKNPSSLFKIVLFIFLNLTRFNSDFQFLILKPQTSQESACKLRSN